MEFLFKSKDVVIVYKPAGVPSQSDPSGDDDIMKLTGDALEAMGESNTLWLVHRLDRTVGGLMVFARNKKTAAELSSVVGSESFEKEYFAVLDGEADGGVLTDYIYKDSRKGKAFVAKSERKGVKLAKLEYSVIERAVSPSGEKTLVKVKLHTGRFHQIRVQFSSRGTPLTGDGKYGSHDNKAKMPALFAGRLAFNLNGKRVEAKKLPSADEYPWSLFKMKEIGDL